MSKVAWSACKRSTEFDPNQGVQCKMVLLVFFFFALLFNAIFDLVQDVEAIHVLW